MGNQKIIDVLIVVITVIILTPFIQGGCSGDGGSSSPLQGPRGPWPP